MWRVLVVLGLLVSLVAATMPTPARRPGIAIATWNMEWLVAPATAHAARRICREGHRAALPCDVARTLSRDSADLARLAWYARRLDADVVAFQEVEDAATAARIFNGFHICIAPGHGLQHAGFAVRPGIPNRCGPPMQGVALGGSQRAGMTLLLHPGSRESIELLAVHLKSGCADADPDSGPIACTILAAQAAQLSQWIQSRAGQRFIVLGDFNRGDADVPNDAIWRALAAGDPAQAAFFFAGEGVPFRNCHIGAGFTRAIDHILVSRVLRNEVAPGSFRKAGFSESDALRYRLTDHCPVSFFLNPGKSPSTVR